MKRIAVFASGFGSNFQSIIDNVKQNKLNATVELLVTDRPNCMAIARAKQEKIEVYSFDPKQYTNKKDYESIILSHLKKKSIDLIVLAGYMRLIGDTLLKQYPGRIINIHPSMLPKYKGMDAIGQALCANETVLGVTVHYVNKEVDSGRIIMQESLDITQMKSRDEIEEKIHQIEHMMYPKAIQKVLEELYIESLD